MDAINPVAIVPVFGDICVRRQRRKRQKRLLVQLFLDFAKNTTLHGLRYITEAGLHITEKLFWSITFLGSAGVCFFFIYNVWYKWHTSPVIVSFSSKHVSPDEVPFPSVTICPHVKFLQKTFNYTEVWRLYEIDELIYTSNNTENITTADVLSLVCDDYETFINSDNLYLNASDVQKLIDLAMDFSDMRFYCEWQGNRCEENLFEKVLTKSGVCYNFNGLNAKEILKDNVQGDYSYIFKTQNSTNWTVDKGYLTNDRENVYPWRGRNSVAKPNLNILLKNMDSKKDNKCNALYSGYKIYLHHPADYPQALLYHFAAVPKMLTSMGIKFTLETANPDLKEYPVEIRQCYFPDDELASLTYFKQYTYNNCMLECLTKYVYKECNCVGFYMPFHNSSRICSAVKQSRCVDDAETKFINSDSIEECKCLPSCNSIQYDAEIHKTDFFVGAYYKAQYGEHFKELNLTYEPERNTESNIEIFFKQPTFRTVHRSVLYGLSDFLGNCGGLLGLFLGFSWLSLVEIFYFLTFRVFKTIRNDLKNEKGQKAKE